MTRTKKLGIWMDHASANLMECTDQIETKLVMAAADDQIENDSIVKGEPQQHKKDQNILSAYYKKLESIIKDYEEVILFGPTNAKTELYNKLQANMHFDKIKIVVQEADKMTENQQHAFVREYFSKN